MTTSKIFTALVAAAVLLAMLSCGRRDPADWTTTVQRVETATTATSNSSEPQLTTSGRGVILSWVERVGKATVLKFMERTGSRWSAPVDVAAGDDWFLSYADVPSVSRLSSGALVAQWMRLNEPASENYDLHVAYSRDDGKTWSASFMPHHDGTKSQHGFASLVELPGNGLGVLWVDGRNSEFRDEDLKSGTMMLRYAAFDSNWKQTADVEVDYRVCECCPTSAAMTDDGVVVAFRDRSDDEVRDIAVSRLEGSRWTAPALIARDNWQIDFCPVNGPALSARGRDVVVSWFTVKKEVGQSFAAFSRDAGRTWGAPIRLDDGGSLGRVDIELLDDGSAVASWIEYAEGRSDFRFRRIDPDGGRSQPIRVAGVTGGRASGYPRLARHGNELVFAWSDSAPDNTGALQVQVAVAKLP